MWFAEPWIVVRKIFRNSAPTSRDAGKSIGECLDQVDGLTLIGEVGRKKEDVAVSKKPVFYWSNREANVFDDCSDRGFSETFEKFLLFFL